MKNLELLLDRVTDDGRIVFTASGTHDPETMDGKVVGIAVAPDATALAYDGKNGAKPLSGGVRYSTSKLCTILYAYELDRRLRKSGSSVASIAFDPGSVPETGLLRTMPKPVQWLARTSLMKWVEAHGNHDGRRVLGRGACQSCGRSRLRERIGQIFSIERRPIDRGAVLEDVPRRSASAQVVERLEAARSFAT